MLGIYLCAMKHRIPGYYILYNDIVDYPGIDYVDSCENINLNKFDYIIATPPCNYYSRANYRRDISKYAQMTKHLLPYCLEKCIESGKPFIVENVCNSTLLPRDYDKYCYRFDYGNHTFWTNVYFDISGCTPIKNQNKNFIAQSKRNGNKNVDDIIKLFLQTIHSNHFYQIKLDTVVNTSIY